jgi:hypothetical protein
VLATMFAIPSIPPSKGEKLPHIYGSSSTPGDAYNKRMFLSKQIEYVCSSQEAPRSVSTRMGLIMVLIYLLNFSFDLSRVFQTFVVTASV